jgi:hypothetical protein
MLNKNNSTDNITLEVTNIKCSGFITKRYVLSTLHNKELVVFLKLNLFIK